MNTLDKVVELVNELGLHLSISIDKHSKRAIYSIMDEDGKEIQTCKAVSAMFFLTGMQTERKRQLVMKCSPNGEV